jgi:hypothetical protein
MELMLRQIQSLDKQRRQHPQTTKTPGVLPSGLLKKTGGR